MIDASAAPGESFALEALEDGVAAAVRAESDRFSTVAAGRVERLGDASAWALRLTDATTWIWDDGSDGVDRRPPADRDHGPPRDVERGDRREYSVDPGITVTDGAPELIVLSAVFDRRGVRYYAPESAGDVVEAVAGEIVDPERLLPDGARPTDEEPAGGVRR